MLSRSLTRTLTVLLVAAMLVLGLASAAHPEEAATVDMTSDELTKACGDMGGDYFESNDGSIGICVDRDGPTIVCDFIEATDANCEMFTESRRVPKDTQAVLDDLEVAVTPGDFRRVPKSMRVLLNALEVVAQPGYCDKKHSRRTQMLLEALTIAVLEGDRGLETCGSSDQPSSAPQRGDGGGSPSTSTSSTTSPPDTTSTSSGDGQLT